MQFLACVVIFLDVPIARQIIVGAFLFLPGVVLLRILRLEIGKIETILFSAGLSVALLMFTGFWMNELYLIIGVLKPLSTLPLMTSLTAIVTLLCIIDFSLNRKRSSPVDLQLTQKVLLLGALVSVPLFLSLIGRVYTDMSGGNALGLLSIITISMLVIISVSLGKNSHLRFYPLAIFAMSLALLFQTSLVSKYLIGYDVHLEYYVSQLTQNASYWSKSISEEYNAMLSITILPTIYSDLLNMDSAWIFKILYPLIFSLVPLGLYQIYKKEIGQTAAFLSVFFFVSSSTFHNVQMLSLARQMIAELFFVLLLYLVFDQKMNPWKRKVLLMIFGGALVVSHYSVSYIYMFYLIAAWVFSRFVKKMCAPTLSYILFFLAVTFSWYIYVSLGAPFTSFVDVIGNMYRHVTTDFFDLETRGYLVERTLGVAVYPSPLHRVGSVIQNVTEFFIVLGFLKTILKPSKTRFTLEFISLSATSILILFLSIVVPFFAPALNVPRFYHITLFLLAPFCVLGIETFFSSIIKVMTTTVKIKHVLSFEKYIKVLTPLILTAFLLFETGFLYEVIGDNPTSIPLSGTKVNPLQFHNAVTSDQEVLSAEWLSKHSNRSFELYADELAKRQVLISYGDTLSARENILSNGTILNKGAYVYLTPLNVVEGKILGRKGQSWNTSDFSLLAMKNKIYSNGASDIYFSPNQAAP